MGKGMDKNGRGWKGLLEIMRSSDATSLLMQPSSGCTGVSPGGF